MKENISKKIKNTLIVFDIIIAIFIFVAFIFKDSIISLIYPLSASFFMLLSFLGVNLLGYRKNKKRKYKEQITNLLIFTSIIYLISIYFIGNATGFIKNENSIINSIYLLLLVIFMELFRYIIIQKCSKKTTQQYIITFLFILFDILVLSSYGLSSNINIFSIITLVITVTMKNALLSYITSKFGFYPCFIYSGIVTIMPYAAPIYPNLGNYLTIVFFIIYTAVIIYHSSKPIHKDDEEKSDIYKKGPSFYIERILLLFVIFIIFLVSGNFKYSLSAIASDSMYPELKKGDAILLEKLDEKTKDSLEKGMIIAFEESGKIITHRILSIENEDGIEYIITKGDNNSTKDVTKKKKDDIIGIVKFRIPLLGYPSVEISEIKNKKD